MSGFLSVVVVIVYVSSTALMLALISSYFSRICRHCALAPAGHLTEERLLAELLPDAQELPHVVVQVVGYNEGGLVQRALHAAARLDWPSHKLHIQMLDDSTDDTLAVARITVADLQATGVDVVLLHRERRDD